MTDQGSRNGTLLNGRRVERAALADGDVLGLGSAQLVFAAVAENAEKSVESA